MSDTPHHTVRDTLVADKSPLRLALATLVVDHLLNTPVNALIDPTTLTDLALAVLASPLPARLIDDHVRPGYERLQQRCDRESQTLGHAVSPALREQIEAILRHPDKPRLQWARDAIDPSLTGQLLAPVFQDVLNRFVQRLPIPGRSHADDHASSTSATRSKRKSGLAGMVKRRAEKVATISKNVMGDLGLTQAFQRAAADFSQTATDDARVALDARLASDEGQNLLAQIISQAMDQVLATPLSEIFADLNRVPQHLVWALGPEALTFNATRAFVRLAVFDELTRYLDSEGQRTIREWFADAGLEDILVETVQANITPRIDAVMAIFFARDDVLDWLQQAFDATV